MTDFKSLKCMLQIVTEYYGILRNITEYYQRLSKIIKDYQRLSKITKYYQFRYKRHAHSDLYK